MAITKEVLDDLLKGYMDPEDITRQDGRSIRDSRIAGQCRYEIAGSALKQFAILYGDRVPL